MAGLILSVVESPIHPNMGGLFRQLGFDWELVTSQRKAIASLKRRAPDFIFAEFFYGYGNNYAGANVSNLDVLLHSLSKYAPEARVIVLAQKEQVPHVDKLTELFTLHAVLPLPVEPEQVAEVLSSD